MKAKIGKDDKHPHLDGKIVGLLEEKYQEFKDGFSSFGNSFRKEIIKKINYIESLKDNNKDIILKKLNQYFETGEEYNLSDLIRICNEGKERYSMEWPPGYEDENDKSGMQIYGDYIIWKQIKDYAKEKECSIIFVLNDIKHDWCFSRKEHGENRIIAPRDELILEIKKEAKVDFWMYTLSQFTYYAKKYINNDLADETIEEVKSVDQVSLKIGLNNIEWVKIEEDKIIKEWIISNYNISSSFIIDFEGRYVDFIFKDYEGFDTGVLIEKISEENVDNIEAIIDWVYHKTKNLPITKLIIFFVFESKNPIFVSQEALQHFKNINMEIISGYIDKDLMFHKYIKQLSFEDL